MVGGEPGASFIESHCAGSGSSGSLSERPLSGWDSGLLGNGLGGRHDGRPLGTFGADAPPVELLQRYAAAFFMLEVKVLPPLPVDPKITWAKFRAMAEGARLASEELW